MNAAWRPSARAKLLVRAALALAALASVLFVAAGPLTLSAPNSCASCHKTAYGDWRASAHASVRCESCHTDRAALGGVGNSFGLAADAIRSVAGTAGTDVSVSQAACLTCHPQDTLDKPKVTNGLRMSHKGLAEARYRCTDCHSDAAHTVTSSRLSAPTMSLCARCHNNQRVSGACEQCHTGTRSPDEARRHDPEWSRTHGANWRQLHGMGDLSTCTMCHKQSECQKCHQVPLPHDTDFIANHGTQAKTSKPACMRCHVQSFCDNCHGLPMPHPADYLPKHPQVAKGYQDPRCARCHIADDCSSCHNKHVHPNGPGIGGSK